MKTRTYFVRKTDGMYVSKFSIGSTSHLNDRENRRLVSLTCSFGDTAKHLAKDKETITKLKSISHCLCETKALNVV